MGSDVSELYRGYRYWLVETTRLRQRWYRIEYPNGHQTPPLPFASVADVKGAIDLLIASEAKAS